MKAIWLNTNKQACKLSRRRSVAAYVESYDADAVFFSEFKKESEDEPLRLDGYDLAFSTRNLGVFVRPTIPTRCIFALPDYFSAVEIGGIIFGSIYLDCTKGGVIRREQFASIAAALNGHELPMILAGDINSALRAADGVYNGSASKWTQPRERLAIDNFLDRLSLADPFIEQGRPLEFSYEPPRQGYRFRSDVLLCSRSLLPNVDYVYDSEPRSSRGFTDHSALIMTWS